MTRHLLAPLRSLALVVLAAAGCAAALSMLFIVTYPASVAATRWFAELGRRLARAWGGVEISANYLPQPTPRRRADGWYVHNNQLFRSPRAPALMLKIEMFSNDPTYPRDWLWLATTPFTGGLVAGAPAGLVLGGVGAAAFGWAPIPIALMVVVAGVILGPASLRLQARWSRILLQPVEHSWWRTSGLSSWIGRRMKATWHGAGLAGMALAMLGFLALQVVFTAVSWGGLLPVAVGLTRPFLGYYRRTAARWSGVDYPEPYRPMPAPPEPDESGHYRGGRVLYRSREAAARHQQVGWVYGDPATWRDLLWTVVGVPLGLLAFVPAVLVGFGLYGLALQSLTWATWGIPLGLAGVGWVTPFYMWHAVVYVVPALGVVPAWLSPLIGVGLAAIGLLLALPLLRLRTFVDGLLLGPTRSTVLARRVHQLTETRTDAVDAQAAELRRIERDLHDGAQARLVSVGLSLATVEQLMERDPAAARQLLAQARETSVSALAELRDLVRGIHPPVLAERGLGDAIRAVALDLPLRVDVVVDLPERIAAPLESAAYFATCEALANAVRHSGATAVTVVVIHTAGVLRITVSDDGRGGAEPSRGSGLRGVRRRLGTFDGVLTVHSPSGGPTVLTMEIPCALSSPRTFTS